MPGNGTSTAAKRAKTKGKDEVMVVEERRDIKAVAQEILMDWEEWSCCSSSMWMVGDEQMSWGTCWCPFWDMELMGEAYNDLYSDVVWDEDIWDLKAIKEIPNS